MSFYARSFVRGLAAASSWTGSSSPPREPEHTIQRRNGESLLGTLQAPHLPAHLGDAPWGDKKAVDVPSIPDTGVVREYDFTVSYQDVAPDGVQRQGVVINGQVPGPTIEANWGDWIQVTVTNKLGDEGTALHWHGLLQQQTPWFDGVPGVMQCPIAPGETFVYKFRADLYGTSWYHSHYSSQYAGGAAGPMIIYGPEIADYDIDLGPVMISDWYHSEYYELVEQTMAPASEGLSPVQSDNNLINGLGSFDCSQTTLPCTPNAGIAKFKFTSGKKHRLRLINAGAEGTQKFSIDGHTLTVIANDFIPVNPYEATAITLGVGQRADVIVEAKGKPTDVVWLRSDLGPGASNDGCNFNNPNASEARAIIYYEDADTDAEPKSSPQSDASLTHCGNEPLSGTTPLQPQTPDPNPSTTEEIRIKFLNNGTHNLWHFGNHSYRADYNEALLSQTQEGNLTYTPQSNVFNFGSNSSVRLVIYNHAAATHPMHMHGHNMFILAEGTGAWDGSIVNAHNPQRRDVQILQPGSDDDPTYIVVQIALDNPGMWPFHCHVAWHVSAGLYLTILERPDDIAGFEIPDAVAGTCRTWDAYTDTTVPDQIDSGL